MVGGGGSYCKTVRMASTRTPPPIENYMKLYKVVRKEFSGYECDGHDVIHLVYANSPEEAASLFPKDNGDLWGTEEYEEEYKLPEVGKKRKGFIIF